MITDLRPAIHTRPAIDIRPAVASWTGRRRDKVIEYAVVLGLVGGIATFAAVQVGNGITAALQVATDALSHH